MCICPLNCDGVALSCLGHSHMELIDWPRVCSRGTWKSQTELEWSTMCSSSSLELSTIRSRRSVARPVCVTSMNTMVTCPATGNPIPTQHSGPERLHISRKLPTPRSLKKFFIYTDIPPHPPNNPTTSSESSCLTFVLSACLTGLGLYSVITWKTALQALHHGAMWARAFRRFASGPPRPGAEELPRAFWEEVRLVRGGGGVSGFRVWGAGHGTQSLVRLNG